MSRPKTVAQLRVVQDDSRRIYFTTPCGCCWRVENETDPGPALIRALAHSEGNDPCFVPSGIVTMAGPGGG